jgi:predicted DNA-binding protein with PD1-like motif
VRLTSGEALPDALTTALREAQVSTGWLRASGVLSDVELRAFDPELGGPSHTRRIAGPVQVLSLDASIGLSDGEVSFTLRALLARETDRGLETLAGEISAARVLGLEALVTALDDVVVERTLDPAAGVWLFVPGASSHSPAPSLARSPAHAQAPARAPAPPPAWASALAASDTAPPPPPERPRYSPGGSPAATVSAPIPQRPAARPQTDVDSPVPEPGDAVDHFAFGRADVLRSDGDRLHLKVHKDGRIREIALEMLRVTREPDADDGRRRYKLERRI